MENAINSLYKLNIVCLIFPKNDDEILPKTLLDIIQYFIHTFMFKKYINLIV